MADADANGSQNVPPTPLETYFRWGTTALLLILRPIGIALYYLVTYLFFGVVFILNLIYQPLAFLLQPVFYLGHFILNILATPFRILTKFETLYIYLAIAALVGITGGLAMSYISGTLHRVLRLDASADPPMRSVRQYREGKRKEKASAAAGPMLSASGLANGYSTSSDGGGRRRKGRSLMAQTILEEDDSDF